MIRPRSLIRIVDNSGAKVGRCIRVLSQSPKTKIGDLAIVSLRKVKPRKVHKGKKKEQLKKGDIRLALIIQIRLPMKRKNQVRLKIYKNYGLMVSPKGKALGSRFRAPLPKELRQEKWIKIVSRCPHIF